MNSLKIIRVETYCTGRYINSFILAFTFTIIRSKHEITTNSYTIAVHLMRLLLEATVIERYMLWRSSLLLKSRLACFASRVQWPNNNGCLYVTGFLELALWDFATAETYHCCYSCACEPSSTRCDLSVFRLATWRVGVMVSYIKLRRLMASIRLLRSIHSSLCLPPPRSIRKAHSSDVS